MRLLKLARLLVFFHLIGSLDLAAQENISFFDRMVADLYADRFPDSRKWISNSMVLGRDGSRMIGSTISESPDHIRLRLNTADTVTIPKTFIDKYYGPKDILIFNRGRYHLKSGLFAAGSIGFGAGPDFTGQINGAIGYRFKERYAAGVGIGFESHESYYAGLYLWDDFFTLYGFGRYYLTNGKKRTYAELKSGYGFAVNDWWQEQHSDGILIQPGIGVIIPSKRSLRWYGSLSQVFQYTKGTSEETSFINSQILAKYKIWYNRTVITVGIELK